MILYCIIGVCVACCFIAVIKMAHIIKNQQDSLEALVNAAYIQLQTMKFITESSNCNLWKIRQEIYNWQCQWVEKEEYEAAQQAKLMLQNIEKLIKLHSNITEGNENN